MNETLIAILTEWHKLTETGRVVSLDFDRTATHNDISIQLFHYGDLRKTIGNESGNILKQFSEGTTMNDDGNLYSCLQYLRSLNAVREAV